MSGERTDRIRETREEIQLPMEEEEAERRIAMVKPPFAERELRFEVGDELLAGFCEGRETGLTKRRQYAFKRCRFLTATCRTAMIYLVCTGSFFICTFYFILSNLK